MSSGRRGTNRFLHPTTAATRQYIRRSRCLSLRDDEFYEKQAIQLRTMPATDVQQTHFASFRRRVNEMLSVPDRQVANIVQAEQLVWSQLAEELMSLNP